MSGDGKDDIDIPAAFLYPSAGKRLLEFLENDPGSMVTLRGRGRLNRPSMFIDPPWPARSPLTLLPGTVWDEQ